MFSPLAMFVLLLGSGCRDVSPVDPPSPPRALAAGVDATQPPFVTKDEDGELQGLGVDMLRDLGIYLNTEVTVVPLTGEELSRELLEKRVDLVLPPPNWADGDDEGLLATDPFAWDGLAMLTLPDRELSNVEELNQSGVTVGVVENTPGQTFANTSLSNPAVRAFESEEAARDALLEGGVDVLVLDPLAVHRIAGEFPERLRAVLHTFRREPRVFKVREDDEGLREDLNEFIQDYREIGGFERLMERHIPEVQRDFQEVGAPLPFDPPEPAVPGLE